MARCSNFRRIGRWVLLGFALGPTACASFLVNQFVFQPVRLPDESSPRSDPRVEEVRFESDDGVELHSLFIRSPGADRAILFLHGNAGHAYHRLDDALALAEMGASVLLLDYRGYGKSGGSPSEEGVYRDARAALDELRDRSGVDQDHVFILGRSLGSAVAVNLATEREVAGLILVSPFTSARAVAERMGFGSLAWSIGNPFDSLRKMSSIRCPVLIIHGDQDEVIPHDLGVELFERCPSKRKELRTVHGAGHNDIISRAGGDYWRWVREFLEDERPSTTDDLAAES